MFVPPTSLTQNSSAAQLLGFSDRTESLEVAAKELLARLLALVPATRGLVLVVPARSAASDSDASQPHEAGGVHRLFAALNVDGSEIENAEYLLDFDLWGAAQSEGLAFRDGVINGFARPALCFSDRWIEHERLLLVVELQPGHEAAPNGIAVELEDALLRASVHLRRLALIERLAAGAEVPVVAPVPASGAVHDAGPVIEYHGMVSRSSPMHRLFETIERIKNSQLCVIVRGETGSGKELVARALHKAGNRRGGPFQALACGAVTATLLESELFGHRRGAFSGADQDYKGIFERADGGTLFLDELSDMSLEMQQKILRVLQEQVVRPVGASQPVPIDVQIIASTRANLEQLVQAGQFREDLYFRLNVFSLEVPSLRDRKADLLLLAERVLADLAADSGRKKVEITDGALLELERHDWPGNVQELRNVLARAIVQCGDGRTLSRNVLMPLLRRRSIGVLNSEDLHQDGEWLHLRVKMRQGFNDIIAECEQVVILHALRRHRGNKSRVTQQLAIPRQTLYNKMDKYGITEEHYQPR
ncbi:MAG: sigma-54 interaction domain-containing protein [Planctomycetota bacterium]